MKLIDRRSMIGLVGGLCLALPTVSFAQTAPMAARQGWAIKPISTGYTALVGRLEDAVKANKMGLVTAASASDGAKAQGFTIPGNRIVGVFRNDFARRILAASIPAGIEAPLRFYITETADGTSILSYKIPSAVLAPYFDNAAADLKVLAGELDVIFAKIAEDTTKP